MLVLELKGMRCMIHSRLPVLLGLGPGGEGRAVHVHIDAAVRVPLAEVFGNLGENVPQVPADRIRKRNVAANAVAKERVVLD